VKEETMTRAQALAAVSMVAMVAMAVLGCDLGGGAAPYGGYGQCAVLDHDIEADTTLAEDCYVVTGVVSVKSGATLTIDPGVKLVFRADAGLAVAGDGTLRAMGSDTEPVTFTGERPVRGHWRGLTFTDSDNDNVIDFAIVEYGGGDTSALTHGKSNVVVQSGGYPVRLSLTNTTIRESAGYGLSLETNASAPMFAGNTLTANALGPAILDSEVTGLIDATSTYSGNDVDFVLVESDTVPTDQTWPAIDVPYFLSGLLYVQAHLTIAAGATLVFDQDSHLQVNDTGTLTAIGDATAMITFSGAEAVRGHWRGLFIVNSDNDNVLEHVIVEHAGSYDGGSPELRAAVVIQSSGHPVRVSITDSTLRQSTGFGLVVPSMAVLPSFHGNAVTGNSLGAALVDSEAVGQLDDTSTYTGNDVDVVVVSADTVPTDQTWSNLGVPYRVGGILFVDARLTVAPGVELDFMLDSRLQVRSTGTLTAVGTQTAPILLTGTSKIAGYWGGVYLADADTDNALEWVTIEYGGGNYPGLGDKANLGAVSTGYPVRFSASHCTFRSSAGYGVWVSKHATQHDMSSNTYSNNTSGDLFEEP
jgi:hypothetical protein